MLVRARAKGLIPDLPDAIGTGWGNNGDRIYQWTGMTGDPGKVQGGPACVGGFDWSNADPMTLIFSGTPFQGRVKSMTLAGFGIVHGTGTWAYDPNKDDAKLTWPTGGDADSLARISYWARRIAAVGGGSVLDTNALANTTWHALGGVPMGSAVDRYGRVLGHRGLYVLDGARIPGSTGACNPSMTIAALAEQSMSHIVRQDLGRFF